MGERETIVPPSMTRPISKPKCWRQDKTALTPGPCLFRPQNDEVDSLMNQVTDEHGLKQAETFATPGAQGVQAGAGEQSGAPTAQAAASGGVEDDLEERLRKLRS